VSRDPAVVVAVVAVAGEAVVAAVVAVAVVAAAEDTTAVVTRIDQHDLRKSGQNRGREFATANSRFLFRTTSR
jgi:hypothetical protein